LEECDVVTERLVDAVLGRSSAESTARMTTVTAANRDRSQKKPGGEVLVVGLPVRSTTDWDAGRFSLGYGYEAENFRISVTGAGYSARATESHMPRWKPLDPVFHRGFSYVGWSGVHGRRGHGGLGGLVELGVEIPAARSAAADRRAARRPVLRHADPSPDPRSRTGPSTRGFVRLAF